MLFLTLRVIRPYLRATAKSLERVKRSLLLLGNMAAKMSVNRPEEEKETFRNDLMQWSIIFEMLVL